MQRLHLVAEVFANALARKEAEDALRASELMKSAILASLSSSVAVLDRAGRVIAVNESWTRFAASTASGMRGPGWASSYLDVCRQAAGEGTAYASEALDGIEAVLDRSRPSFALEYSQGAPLADRWFAMSVVPLNRPEGGAVVSHTDITERKRAELDAQRSRQELAHFTRVSTMGELTASLAHELNQPLTGILANAQAARRFLDATPPDLGEVREILSDIVEDDKRAAEVIQRLRDLLRKGESQQLPPRPQRADPGRGQAGQQRRRHPERDRHARPRSGPADGERRPGPAAAGRPQSPDQRAWRRWARAPRTNGRSSSGPSAPTRRRAGVGAGRGAGAPRRHAARWSSSRSTPRSPQAWGWGWRSPARSSRPTAAASGPRTTRSRGATFHFALPGVERP